MMDINGDGISDILGMAKTDSSKVHSLICFAGSRSNTFEACQQYFKNGDFTSGPYSYFPHIFVDLDGDLSSEIIFGMADSKVPLRLMAFKKGNK